MNAVEQFMLVLREIKKLPRCFVVVLHEGLGRYLGVNQ